MNNSEEQNQIASKQRKTKSTSAVVRETLIKFKMMPLLSIKQNIQGTPTAGRECGRGVSSHVAYKNGNRYSLLEKD